MGFGAANISKHLEEKNIEMVKSVSYSKFNSICILLSTRVISVPVIHIFVSSTIKMLRCF